MTDDKYFRTFEGLIELKQNESWNDLIKNTVYISSNKTLKLKKCQLKCLLILVSKMNIWEHFFATEITWSR